MRGDRATCRGLCGLHQISAESTGALRQRVPELGGLPVATLSNLPPHYNAPLFPSSGPGRARGQGRSFSAVVRPGLWRSGRRPSAVVEGKPLRVRLVNFSVWRVAPPAVRTDQVSNGLMCDLSFLGCFRQDRLGSKRGLPKRGTPANTTVGGRPNRNENTRNGSQPSARRYSSFFTRCRIHGDRLMCVLCNDNIFFQNLGQTTGRNTKKEKRQTPFCTISQPELPHNFCIFFQRNARTVRN